MEKETNKTKWLHVRLSEDEYKLIHKQFDSTTCRKMSEYARKKLLEKHLTTYYRNKSLDDLMAELMPVRKSLLALSNNFNQAIRKLNSMQQSDYAQGWIKAYEREVNIALQQVAEVNIHIQKFAGQWLQYSTPTLL